MAASYTKVPVARLDYTWEWGPWLADVSDTIDSVTVTVPEGLTAVGVPVVDGGDVTQRVEGGVLDDAYRMVCRIQTVGGLIDEEPIYLVIRDK